MFIAITVLALWLIYNICNKKWKQHLFWRHFPKVQSKRLTLKNFEHYIKTYGPMVHVKVNSFRNILLTSDYDFLKFLLGSKVLINKSDNFKFLEPWLGKNIITIDGDAWRKHRRFLAPAFYATNLERSINIFDSNSKVLVQQLSCCETTECVDVYPVGCKAVFRIAIETLTGISVDAEDHQTALYLKNVEEMLRIYKKRMSSALLQYDFFFRFTENYHKQQQICKELNNYVDVAINTKLTCPNKNETVFLELLSETYDNTKEISFKEFKNDFETLLFAGYDTTAVTLGFTLYLLASDKAVQDRVYEEQQCIFGPDQNSELTYDKLQQMQYLEKAIKETLRLYPVASVYSRLIDQDVEYKGIAVPKGTRVTVFVAGIHKNPDFFPNPDKFDPDRFGNGRKIPPFAFIPFSAGPRNCIGRNHAMLVLKSSLSHIVRNFELFPAKPSSDVKVAADIVLRPLNGIKIGLKVRSQT